MNESLQPDESLLSEALLERVLAGLEFQRFPVPSYEALCGLYAAWCKNVPFDNVRKLIHVRGNDGSALPGSTPTDFLEAWLKFGTGGTCWAGAGAFHAVLATLGFDAKRTVGTMMAAPDLPPNHGSVSVNFGSERYLVDCSILHGEPLPLREFGETRIAHPAWGISCSVRAGKWHVQWRPLHKVDGFECRLESFGARQEEFFQSYARTRGWSPFNYQLTGRKNVGNRVVGVAFGKAVSLEYDGSVRQQPVSADERARLLIEDLGISEEIVQRLPEDVPTPPPPGSRTAQTQLA